MGTWWLLFVRSWKGAFVERGKVCVSNEIIGLGKDVGLEGRLVLVRRSRVFFSRRGYRWI